MSPLLTPFPWFGGKSRVAATVWSRFGDVHHYIEPFAGSLAVLFGRPHVARHETVNDLDCFLANFWRGIALDPVAVAHYASWPQNEADLHARHLYIGAQTDFRERMHTDPLFFDPKIAGWWLYGISIWIGDGWCQAFKSRRRIQLTSPQGVNRFTLIPGTTLPFDATCDERTAEIIRYALLIADRLRNTRVCCGDWGRVVTPAIMNSRTPTGVFLDPPYGTPEVASDLYTHHNRSVAAECAAWAIANGDNPNYRIAVCGYEGEHEFPDTWECVPWKTCGGLGGLKGPGQNENRFKERIWFSPHCNKPQGEST